MLNDKDKKLRDKLDAIRNYNNEVYAKTKKYQKKYGFKIGEGEHDAWNNEADAFKHTFMQADLALRATSGLAKIAGDNHEEKGNKKMGQSAGEENMDRWNNAVGREIAKEIAKEMNYATQRFYIMSGKMNDIIAEKVMNKMKSGELITDPFKDKRDFASSHHNGRIFTREEIDPKNMSVQEFRQNEKAIMKQMTEKGVPINAEAQKAVSSGGMIYVESYTRGDGTEVKGYYRSK